MRTLSSFFILISGFVSWTRAHTRMPNTASRPHARPALHASRRLGIRQVPLCLRRAHRTAINCGHFQSPLEVLYQNNKFCCCSHCRDLINIFFNAKDGIAQTTAIFHVFIVLSDPTRSGHRSVAAPPSPLRRPPPMRAMRSGANARFTGCR